MVSHVCYVTDAKSLHVRRSYARDYKKRVDREMVGRVFQRLTTAIKI